MFATQLGHGYSGFAFFEHRYDLGFGKSAFPHGGLHTKGGPKILTKNVYLKGKLTQGLTCDRVFYNAESTSRTTAQDTYYVSISRERHDVVVFTDNAQKLPDAVARVPYKGLAHDLVPVDPQAERANDNPFKRQRMPSSLEMS